MKNGNLPIGFDATCGYLPRSDGWPESGIE